MLNSASTESLSPNSESESSSSLEVHLQVNLPRVGAVLQHYRIKRGLTLEVCCHRLKIRRQYLAALEEDDLDVLPSNPTTLRAYVKSYAQMLDLDAVGLADHFSKSHQIDTSASIPRQMRSLPMLPSTAVLFLVIGILIASLTFGVARDFLGGEKFSGEIAVIPIPPLRGSGQLKEEASAVKKSVSSVETGAVLDETTPEAVEIVRNVRIEPPASATPESIVPVSEAMVQTPESTPLRFVTARVQHSHRLWISIRNDIRNDQSIQHRLLAPQEVLDLPIGEKISFRISEPEGVHIVLMGALAVPESTVSYGELADGADWIDLNALM